MGRDRLISRGRGYAGRFRPSPTTARSPIAPTPPPAAEVGSGTVPAAALRVRAPSADVVLRPQSLQPAAIVGRHKDTVSASSASGGPYFCVSLPLGGGSGRSQSET